MINYIRNNIESVFEKHTDFETWIEGVMETEFPKEVVAINFNIYDDGDGKKWSTAEIVDECKEVIDQIIEINK